MLGQASGIGPNPSQPRTEHFYARVRDLTVKSFDDWCYRTENKRERALKSAEHAVRAARDAIQALNNFELKLLIMAIEAQTEDLDYDDQLKYQLFENQASAKEKLPRMFSVIADALAKIVGVNPGRRSSGRPGRPTGAVGNWPFYNFVRSFWISVEEFGGKLTLTIKDGEVKSGRLVEVLQVLRRWQGEGLLLPPELIPKRLSAKVLNDIKKEVFSTPRR
jgi:hypothetical protein